MPIRSCVFQSLCIFTNFLMHEYQIILEDVLKFASKYIDYKFLPEVLSNLFSMF
jgi:hypothetical protein